jgi:hypothetical protein
MFYVIESEHDRTQLLTPYIKLRGDLLGRRVRGKYRLKMNYYP